MCGSKTRGLSTLRVQRIRDLTREARGPPFNYYGGGGGAGVFELDQERVRFFDWTNYFFHFLSAKLNFFHTLPKRNIYFSLCLEIYIYFIVLKKIAGSQTTESDVYKRLILTSKVDLRIAVDP